MMKANRGGRPPEFFSTHPAETNRIQRTESLLPAVIPLYEAARRQG
jgi:predicted Zn-dependent protease